MYKYTCLRDVNVTHVGYSAWHLITRAKEHISNQRWSPRGHILKSLALASKVKSLALASRPQVLENWPVLGSRTALFFELLKFCGALFFWRALALVSLVLGLGFEHSCPWPRECLSSEWLSLALASDFFCVLGLEPCVLDFTSVSDCKSNNCAVKNHILNCNSCLDENPKFQLDLFSIMHQCNSAYEAKINQALLIKKQNPTINKQMYANGASFLLSVY